MARVETHEAERNGVVQVKAFTVMRDKLAAVGDLDSVMAAGWEVFEFIDLVAYRYGGLKSNGFATWMTAIGPASDGTGLLEPGPDQYGVRLEITPDDLNWGTEDEAFTSLAALAAELKETLLKAARDPRPDRVHDAKACAKAAEAAAELHELFVLDE